MGIEIERKFTVKRLPDDLERFPVHIIEQGYLSVVPAIRVRRQDDSYYMTYKSDKGFGSGGDKNAGDIGRTEYNLPLDRESYKHLILKADGNIIRKRRYIIPLNEDAFSKEFLREHPDIACRLEAEGAEAAGSSKGIDTDPIRIELDVFEDVFEGRILAEVEFPDEDSAAAYHPADWFLEDVTGDVRYSNAHMSIGK